MIIKQGKGARIVWDGEENKALVAFVNKEIECKDDRVISILRSKGYECIETEYDINKKKDEMRKEIEKELKEEKVVKPKKVARKTKKK